MVDETEEPWTVGQLVGKNVRRWREERLLTQAELSAQLRHFDFKALSRASLSLLESGGRADVTVGEVTMLAHVLGTDTLDLFAGDAHVRIGDHLTITAEELRRGLAGIAPPGRADWEPGASTLDDAGLEDLLADRLGLTAPQVRVLAKDLWGHGLAAQREVLVDALMAEQSDDTPGTSAVDRRGRLRRRATFAIAQDLERHKGKMVIEALDIRLAQEREDHQ